MQDASASLSQNSQTFNNGTNSNDSQSLVGGGAGGVEERRTKKRQRKQDKTRKLQSKVIYHASASGG